MHGKWSQAGVPQKGWSCIGVEDLAVAQAALFDWSREQVVAFTTTNEISINPLHEKGFVSIGCAPCTRAIAPGEPERTDRWWEDEKKERVWIAYKSIAVTLTPSFSFSSVTMSAWGHPETRSIDCAKSAPPHCAEVAARYFQSCLEN